MSTKATPNPSIDKAIKKMMDRIDDNTPLETAVKVITAAVNWEKVKAGLDVDATPYDPDSF